jgi:hypothetical protein
MAVAEPNRKSTEVSTRNTLDLGAIHTSMKQNGNETQEQKLEIFLHKTEQDSHTTTEVTVLSFSFN